MGPAVAAIATQPEHRTTAEPMGPVAAARPALDMIR